MTVRLGASPQDAAHQCVCELGPALRPGVWNRGWHPSQAVVSMPLGFEVEGTEADGVEVQNDGSAEACVLQPLGLVVLFAALGPGADARLQT